MTTPPSTLVLDGGWRTTKDAEHAVRETTARLGLRPVTACTHFARDPARVVVGLRLDVPVPASLIESGLLGTDREAARLSPGRAFVFPGSDALTGVLPAGDLLTRTAIDEIRLLGGGTVDPGTDLDTQDFMRPGYEGQRLVLLTRPARGGRLVPFEQPNPTPCCADH